MKDNDVKIEQRLQNIKNIYLKTDELIDKYSDAIPDKYRDLIKKLILGDKDLKDLMDGIDSHRPPRIMLIGRTGVGKSSLINAICGTYIAKVSDTTACTAGLQSYPCKDGDRVLMEILDSRGIAESDSLNADVSAEDMLAEQVNEFSPDVAILMLSCTHRDDVHTDVQYLKKLAKSYQDFNGVRLPIVAVINKCDEMAPARFKTPSEYPQNKVDKIQEVLQYYKGIIIKNGLKIDQIIAVSSLIDWQTPDDIEIGVEDIDNLPESDIANLQIAFDGRYHIKELLDILEDVIVDTDAQMGLKMAARLEDVVHKLAGHLNNIFSGISAAVAVTPIPISDIYILLTIQFMLVTLIAALSGREITADTAKEFVISIGGVTGVGYSLRAVAQQATKLLNVVIPGSGSVISSAIAGTGTAAIGNAAIAYYIDGKDLSAAKKIFKASQKEAK